MFEAFAHILMWAGGTIAVLIAFTIWVVLMIAIFDMAGNPTLEDIRHSQLIRKITSKLEEYRNARS